MSATERPNSIPRIEAPREIAREEAQEQANFLILSPMTLPDDLELAAETFRPELPPGRPEGIDLDVVKSSPWTEANTCTLRSEYVGEGRRIRLKQFFYDWAPPAGTIAALWDSPCLTPVVCDQTVGWIGEDYKGGRGATIERFGTQVELSVLEGAMTDVEIGELFRSLKPACPALFDKVPRCHEQNYWIRYRVPPLKTPPGLWVHPHRRAYDGNCVVAATNDRVLDWKCVSSVVMTAEIDNHLYQDHERVFLHETDADAWAIVSAIPKESPVGFAFPPVLEQQQIGFHQTWEFADTKVFAAAIDAEFGGWDLRWQTKGKVNSLWTSASLLWSRSSVEQFVKQLI